MRDVVLVFLLAATLLVPVSGLAQEDEAQGTVVDEVTVTAQKREESLQDVPVSITAIAGDDLTTKQIDDVQQVTFETPSLSYSRAGGEAQVFIRGVGTDAFGVTIDPSVAIQVDGVYQARPQMGLQQFLDVERVEVLRGPQGTLYGRNATAGVINIVTRRPTNETEANLALSLGEFDRFDVQGGVGSSLNDYFSARLAGRILQDSGFTDDLDEGGANDIDDNGLATVRASLAFQNGSNFFGSLAVDLSDFSSGNRTIRPLDDLGIADTLGAQPLPAFGSTRNPDPTFLDHETTGFTLDLQFVLSDTMTLTSITGYRDFDMGFLFNTDGTEIDVTRTNFVYESEQISEELRLSGQAGDNFRWLVGAYYLDEDKRGALGLQRWTNNRTAVDPFTIILPNDDTGEAYALFFDGTYSFNEQVSLSFGGRYSDEEKTDITSFANRPGTITLTDASQPGLFVIRDAEADWDDFSPRVVLEISPDSDQLYYFSVSKGFKSGGWNAFGGQPAFEPEELWAYEVGAKTDLADRRVRLNGSLFFYDYSDLQVNTFQNGVAITTNAAEATVLGLEGDLIARLSEQLTLKATYTYLDTEYDEFVSPFGGLGPQDLSGNQLRNAPENKLSASIEYRSPLANDGELSFYAGATYQDDVFYSQFNEAIIGQDAFTLFDAQITYHFPDERFEVGLWGKNLGDEEYIQNAVRFTSTSDQNPGKDTSAIGNALGYPAPGRSFGVRLGVRF